MLDARDKELADLKIEIVRLNNDIANNESVIESRKQYHEKKIEAEKLRGEVESNLSKIKQVETISAIKDSQLKDCQEEMLREKSKVEDLERALEKEKKTFSERQAKALKDYETSKIYELKQTYLTLKQN